MKGFFDPPKKESINRVKGKPVSCAACGLYQHVKSPRMEPFGNFKKGILNVGEAPGEMEDARGKQWQGKVSRLLQRTYKELGIDLFEDCLNINAVNCRPMDKKGNNRAPTDHEIACCRSRVWKVIEERKPKIIIALGNAAIVSLIGHRWKKNFGGISKWRGWTIPDQDIKSWICPTFHPSYIDQLDTDEARMIWKQDLSAAFSMLKESFPAYKVAEDCVSIIDSPAEITSLLRNIIGSISIDIETNSIKSHSEESRLVSFAFCTSEESVFSFLLPSEKTVLKEIRRVLRRHRILKFAHNLKFEHSWIHNKLGYEVRNWKWDSMLAAHILDNRPGITGLKFQTYVNFGIIDYDSEISPYLKSTDSKNGNAINRIHELISQPEGKRKLLLYNGLDALYTYRLTIKQRKEMGYER